jgi:hypothetical protein
MVSRIISRGMYEAVTGVGVKVNIRWYNTAVALAAYRHRDKLEGPLSIYCRSIKRFSFEYQTDNGQKLSTRFKTSQSGFVAILYEWPTSGTPRISYFSYS